MQRADSAVAPPPETGRSSRFRGRRWIALAAGVAFLAALALWAFHFGPGWDRRRREFQEAFVGVSWPWLAFAAALVLLTYVGRALRWAVMMQPVKKCPSFWSVLDATCIGFTAIVLFGRAGELVRPYLIAVRERVPVPSQVAAWVLERVLDLMMVLLMFGAALAGMSGHTLGAGALAGLLRAGGTIIAVAGLACIGFVLAFRYLSGPMQRRVAQISERFPERVRPRVHDLMRAFIDGMGCTRSAGYVSRLLAYSLAEWVVIAAMFASVLRAFPATARLGLADAVVALGVVAVGSAVQLPGVGGGMQVATVLVLTEMFGVPLGSATGIALVLWAISFLLIVPFGVLLAIRHGLSLTNLTKISEQSAQASQS